MARLAALAASAASVLFATTGTATAAVTCDFTGTTLTVHMSGAGDKAKVDRATGGDAIQVLDSAGSEITCTPPGATVHNTDLITAQGTSDPNQRLTVIEPESLEPGLTAEPGAGAISEIEVVADAVAQVFLEGASGAQHKWTLSSTGVSWTGTDVDEDLTLQNPPAGFSYVSATGGSLDDTLDARGASSPNDEANYGVRLNGGGGNDVLKNGDSNTAAVSCTFGLGCVDPTGLYGGAGADTLVGGGNFSQFNGGDGDDTIKPGIGTNVLSYDDAPAGVTIDLAVTGSPQDTGGAGRDTLTGSFDQLTGSPQSDVLRGSDSASEEFLVGGAGDDTLEGRGGPDSFFGEEGNDTISYASAPSAVSMSLTSSPGGVASGGAGQDTVNFSGFVDVENLTGSAYGDTLTGDGNANVLTGGGGADTLQGLAGADTLIGTDGGTVDDLQCGSDSDAVQADDVDTVAADCELVTRADTTPPDTSFATPVPALFGSRSPSFGFTSSEGGGTFECRVDAAAFGACANPFTASTLGEGPHTFEVRARDAAGNADPTPASASFTVDVTPPDTAVTDKPAAKSADTHPSFVFSSEAGAGFECRLDGVAFAACTSRHAAGVVAPGKHTFSVRARDAAGNVDSTPATAAFEVVLSLKRLKVTTAKITYRLNSAAKTTFRVQRRQGSGWKTLKGSFRHSGKAGANKVPFDGSLRGKPLSPGRYRLVARAKTRAGVKSAPARAKFRIK